MVNQKRKIPVRWALLGVLLGLISLGRMQTARADSNPGPRPHGIVSRVVPPAYLRLPHRAGGKIPSLLSQTGAFKDVRNLVPADGLIPYEIGRAHV